MHPREIAAWCLYALGVACGVGAAYVKAGLFEALSTAGPALLGAAGLLGYGAKTAAAATVTPPPK